MFYYKKIYKNFIYYIKNIYIFTHKKKYKFMVIKKINLIWMFIKEFLTKTSAQILFFLPLFFPELTNGVLAQR